MVYGIMSLPGRRRERSSFHTSRFPGDILGRGCLLVEYFIKEIKFFCFMFKLFAVALFLFNYLFTILIRFSMEFPRQTNIVIW